MLSREELDRVEKTVKKAVKQRNLARAKKLFDFADEIRQALVDMGVELQDTSGTTSTWCWSRSPQVEADTPLPKKKMTKRHASDHDAPELNKKAKVGVEAPTQAEASQTTSVAKPSLKLDGGIVAKILREGDGSIEAKRKCKISVKYSGVLAKTGRRFDAGNFTFKLGSGEVIKGWDVGCEGMKVGEKRRLTIPPKMAYGARGAPPDIPKNATLIFDVTLLKA